MDTLLLVEDDKLFRHTIRDCLENEDFIVFEAISGKRSIEILSCHHVDIVLLDIHLPDGSGLDFIRDIRQRTDAPVIIVSGDDETSCRLDGFERGADDYVSKPFLVNELVARIKANLRRYKGEVSNDRNKNFLENDKIEIGDWIFDRSQYQLFDQLNQSAGLTAREFRLLDYFINNEGRVLQRGELCEALREQNYTPTPRAIDVKITRIRHKIGDDSSDPKIIKTVWGIGYIYNSETEKSSH